MEMSGVKRRPSMLRPPVALLVESVRMVSSWVAEYARLPCVASEHIDSQKTFHICSIALSQSS